MKIFTVKYYGVPEGKRKTEYTHRSLIIAKNEEDAKNIFLDRFPIPPFDGAAVRVYEEGEAQRGKIVYLTF